MISTKSRVPRQLIAYILKKGNSYKSPLFLVRYVKNDKHFSRYRAIISKKLLRGAVERNKLRRQIYEIIRTKDPGETSNPQDIILIPKKNVLTRTFQQIEEDITKNIINRPHDQSEQTK